jgi:hypothetical protein
MGSAGLDLNVNVNSMSQPPSNGAYDLDAQLQLAAEDISIWTEPFSNLDLSVYTFITEPVFVQYKYLRCFYGEN